jgi:hypothetical protein
MFAEPNRTPVTVEGPVPHIEDGQMNTASRCQLRYGVFIQSASKVERMIYRHRFDG